MDLKLFCLIVVTHQEKLSRYLKCHQYSNTDEHIGKVASARNSVTQM